MKHEYHIGHVVRFYDQNTDTEYTAVVDTKYKAKVLKDLLANYNNIPKRFMEGLCRYFKIYNSDTKQDLQPSYITIYERKDTKNE